MMDLADAQAALAGAMISVATPTTGDFTLDLAAYRRNLRFMVERGVRRGNGVLLVAAAGGEFPMLTTEERKTLMRVAVETVGDVVPIAASLQSNSTREALDLAKYAREVGVTIGQLSAPYYYEPTTEDIYHLFRDVAASRLPLMIYNNWWNTSNMNCQTVLRLAEIDGVVAVKWSAPTFNQYIEGYELFPEKLAIIDNELQHVMASLHRSVGFITHISNFWPEYPLRLWQLMSEHKYEELNAALRFKRRWLAWREKVEAYTEGEGPFIKAAMDAVGLHSGDPFRPALPVSPALREELRCLLTEFDVPRVAG
jgi:4-hydroxy-tetrahydrodipicolinate synthase